MDADSKAPIGTSNIHNFAAMAMMYIAWTPTRLKVVSNDQYAANDPIASAHNGQYVLGFLYGNITEAVVGDVSGMTRPLQHPGEEHVSV